MNPLNYIELQDLATSNVIVDTRDYPKKLSKYKSIKGKVIILSQHGDLLLEENIKNSLERNNNNYYIFLTTHDVSLSLKDDLAGVASFFTIPSAYAEYVKSINTVSVDLTTIPNSQKIKHFLSLNNRASWFRQGLFYFFKNFNLLEKSYFSYIGDLDRSNYSSLDAIDVEFISSENGKVWYANNIDFKLIKNQIPYFTGLEIPKGIDWTIGHIKYYQDCFCSIVTETYSLEQQVFFTEKTFKPILFYQPFLLHSNPNSYKKLQDIGFKTFENWFDCSYDSLSGRHRFESMLKLILEIGEWSVEKINKTYQEMLPVLEYNHNHFTTTLPMLYNEEITKIKNKIREIIDNQ